MRDKTSSSSSMLLAIFCIAMTSVIFVRVETVSYSQSIYLYLGQDFNDKYVCLTRTSANNLSAYDFNDKTHSIKYNGIYLLYEHINYNEENQTGFVISRHGFDGQERFPKCDVGEAFSSVRLVGNPSNWSSPSITLFEKEDFLGLKTFYTDVSKPNLWFNTSSIIITGGKNQSWTFYEEVDYAGKSYCLTSKDEEDVSFFPYWKSTGLPVGKIFRSLEKGCWECSTTTTPSPPKALKKT